MARNHQPDQSTFRAVLPEDIDWQPFPAFPSGARLAVMVGHPAEPGPYVVRVKVPGGTRLMPHKHPEDRIYTHTNLVWQLFRRLRGATGGNTGVAVPRGAR